MKRSEIINEYRETISAEMLELYQTVLECNGRIQYKLYIWEDGEIERLQGPQGDNSWLKPREYEPRELYYICTIDAPFFNPWDIADHSAPEDEDEREAERAEIIDYCMESYSDNLSDLIESIISDAIEIEQFDD